jgi:4-amino-4-deoxy-L-arabinose transferase-like glycosyltransferase
MDVASQARLLLFAWAGTILGFFTLEGGSRMEYYSFGAWPALALLLGVAIADAEGEDETPVLWVTRVLAALGALFAIGAGAFLWLSARTPPAADITTHLRTHDAADFYRTDGPRSRT